LDFVLEGRGSGGGRPRGYNEFADKPDTGKIGKAFEKTKNGFISSELLNPKSRNGNFVETRSATPRQKFERPPVSLKDSGVQRCSSAGQTPCSRQRA
jgi:hypothetical protein